MITFPGFRTMTSGNQKMDRKLETLCVYIYIFTYIYMYIVQQRYVSDHLWLFYVCDFLRRPLWSKNFVGGPRQSHGDVWGHAHMWRKLPICLKIQMVLYCAKPGNTCWISMLTCWKRCGSMTLSVCCRRSISVIASQNGRCFPEQSSLCIPSASNVHYCARIPAV